MTKCEWLLLFFISLSKNCWRVIIQGDNNTFHPRPIGMSLIIFFYIGSTSVFYIGPTSAADIGPTLVFYIGPTSAADIGPIYLWRSVSTAGGTNCSWEWTSNLPLATDNYLFWDSNHEPQRREANSFKAYHLNHSATEAPSVNTITMYEQ